MNDDQIQKSIDASRAKYAAIKRINQKKSLARKEFKRIVHEGNEYYDANSSNIRTGAFWIEQAEGFNISWAIHGFKYSSQLMHSVVGYSIMSPTDKWKPNVGRGLSCYRIKEENEWTFELEVPPILWKYDKQTVEESVQNIITSRIRLLHSKVPNRLKNAMYGNLFKLEPAYKLIDRIFDALNDGDFDLVNQHAERIYAMTLIPQEMKDEIRSRLKGFEEQNALLEVLEELQKALKSDG